MAIKVASKQTATLSTASVGSTEPAPSITSVVVSNTAYNADIDDLALPTTGGNVKLLGKGFTSNYNLFWNGANITANSFFVSSREIRTGVPASSAGNYSFMLFNNNSRAGAIYANYPISGFPTWTTGTYTSTVFASVSVQLLASGDAPLTYALQSGSSLPANVTLSSSGLLSGTNATAGVYSFTVIVDDAQLQSTQQAIILTIGEATDTNFRYNALLLSADGTNNANNHSFVDSSTNNFPITRSGNSTQGTFSPYGANWSNFFDGAGDFLSVADNSAFVVGTGNFTIEAWIYPTQVAAAESPIFKLHSADSIIELRQNTNKLDCFLAEISTSVTTSIGTIAIALNTWNHVAFVRNGTTTYTFVNGVLDQTKTAQTQNLTTLVTTKRIAANQLTNAFFTGYISNFRFVKGTAVYTSNFTPPTTPLTAISGTSLLTCQSNRFIDNSTNLFTVTVSGDTKVQRFSPFSPTQAYSASTIGGSGYFDGTGDYLSIPTNAVFDFASGDFTVEAWIYLTTLTPAGGGSSNALTVITALPSSGTITGWGLDINNTNYVYWDNWVSNAEQNITATNNPITINTWYHVAVTRQSGTFRIFVNGNLCTTTGTVSQATNTGGNPIQIGAGPYTGYPNGLTGQISNLRVVKGVAVYTTAFTPPTTPLTATQSSGTNIAAITGTSTSLLTNFTNAGIYDATMMNNIETVGDAKISTTQSKFGGSSMSFDGTGDYLTSNPATTDLYAFGSGDFTIEMWLYLNSVSGTQVFYDQRPAAGGVYPTLYMSGSTLYYYTNAANRITGSTLSTSQWYHIAVSRSGTSTKLFVNGTQSGSTYTDTNVYLNAALRPFIGGDGTNIGTGGVNGYIDDLRITKGFARYTANFATPTAALEVQ